MFFRPYPDVDRGTRKYSKSSRGTHFLTPDNALNQSTLNRVIEEHRQALLNAGNDPIRVIAANKRFWARKLGYINYGQSLSDAYAFNPNTLGSYHPWSARSIGVAFGNDGLKEIISIKDYLDLPIIADEFLEGVAEGTKRAMARKAAEAAKQGKQQGQGNLLAELSKLLKEGK